MLDTAGILAIGAHSRLCSGYNSNADPTLRVNSMSIEIDATYEDGMLKPDRPLPLKEHQRVKVVVQGEVSYARRAYGIIGFQGDPEIVRKVALEPEFGLPESP